MNYIFYMCVAEGFLFNSDDSFEEYHWMKVELRHLSGLFPSLNRGNVYVQHVQT